MMSELETKPFEMVPKKIKVYAVMKDKNGNIIYNKGENNGNKTR